MVGVLEGPFPTPIRYKSRKRQMEEESRIEEISEGNEEDAERAVEQTHFPDGEYMANLIDLSMR